MLADKRKIESVREKERETEIKRVERLKRQLGIGREARLRYHRWPVSSRPWSTIPYSAHNFPAQNVHWARGGCVQTVERDRERKGRKRKREIGREAALKQRKCLR